MAFPRWRYFLIEIISIWRRRRRRRRRRCRRRRRQMIQEQSSRSDRLNIDGT